MQPWQKVVKAAIDGQIGQRDSRLRPMTYVNKRHARHFGYESVKPTIPEHVERFAAYYAKNPVWGSLHVVLDEPNYSDADVLHCMDVARANGDTEGLNLAAILLLMSKTQRSKIGWMAEHIDDMERGFIKGTGTATSPTGLFHTKR